MKINNNISAVITNKHLLRTEDSLADAMERLSSGIQINHAGDDPSGVAISSKMQTQIDGLDQASQNSSDGMSVLETADGALNEVMDMLQRMRELSIQAANGTNSKTDREAIQAEIDQLRDEVDRVSSTTEFNTKKLLDGSLDKRVYAKGVTRVQITDEVPEGIYNFDIEKLPTKGTLDFGMSIENLAANIAKEGIMTINGSSVELYPGMDSTLLYEEFRNAAELGDADITDRGVSPFSITSSRSGASESLTITLYPPDAISNLDTSTAAGWGPDPNNDGAFTYRKDGTDGVIKLDTVNGAFSTQRQATINYNGDRFSITDTKGFKMEMMFDREVLKPTNEATGEINPAHRVSLDITEIGPMNIQVGANEGQQINVRIQSTSAESMYLDEIDVVKVGGPERAMDTLTDAIARLSEIRSDIGAYTNRLEHSVKSLDQTNENMNAAISRLQDTNMAKEMSEYTKFNVLQQAATSALSQANELPSQALQLLG